MIRALSSNRLRLALLFSSAVATTAFACGGISDPTRGGSADGTVATVSGALTGTSVPANARVALVWRNASAASGSGIASVEVGSDVPVVDGKFTMSLAIPSAAYFANVDDNGFGSASTFDTPVAVGTSAPSDPDVTPPPAPAGGSGSGGGKAPGAANAGNAASSAAAHLAPKDTAVGGTISQPLSAAIAGFVVYADTNGNGKLDLAGPYAASTDTILGGNQELILAYLKDGGALDYEKLRDKSGILPAAGFNVAWSQGRWLPLDVVELKLGTVNLPTVVCQSAGAGTSGSGGVSSTGSGGAPTPITPKPLPDAPVDGGSAPGVPGYPSPTDPNLQCAPDGKSFTYYEGSSCAPPPRAPVGLCAPNYDTTEPCGRPGFETTLPADGTVPANWPCPVSGSNPGTDGGTPVLDGGAAPDAG